ncbi:MAG: type II and III secretion system protein, partial [Deltaproteobacteria bacterium]|nr:type II and III secretion system protein [Deltaproteobacteria bacterium]
YASSGATPLTETNIQYRDTGILLTVTPHINERGLVSMEISQEVSEQSEPVLVGGTLYPSFFKRTVNTTLTVRHSQTIVIGGLIRENLQDSASGVPWLIDIPIVRWIFGTEKESISKNELIILITPYVISNQEDVEAVTEEFKIKLGDVMFRSM